jgi:O-antigen/teichoic acid export membrane protein
LWSSFRCTSRSSISGVVGRETATAAGTSRLPAALRLRLGRYNLAVAALLLLNMIVWQRSELIFLGRFRGAQEVAYYALPFSLTERLTELVPGALLGVVLPGLTHAHGAADAERFTSLFSDSLQWLVVLTLPICLFGIPLAGTVIGVLYGPRYGLAVPVLQILLAAMVFGVIGQAASSALLGLECQAWLLKTGAMAAAASIALDLVLIPRWGALGAALANSATQAGWSVAALVPLWRRVRADARAAVLRAVGAALPLSFLLTVAVLSGLASPALVLSGAAAAAAYLLALERMRLFSARLLLARLLPTQKVDEAVPS